MILPRTSIRVAVALLLPLVFLISAGSVEGQGKPEGIIPAKPESLLKVLPKDVEKWDLIKSEGLQDQDDWLYSVATRVFTKERPESNPGPTMKTSIKVTDTGGYAPARAIYANFAPATGNRFEKKYIESFPAILIQYGPEKFETELLVNDRFIVEIISENQPMKFTKEWLKRIDFAQLSRIKKGPVVGLPEIVEVRKIDELKKDKNRSYEVALVSGEEVDKASIADLAAEGEEILDETDKAAAAPDPEPEGAGDQ